MSSATKIKGRGGGGGPKKSRFDGLDVAAMTAHVRRTLLGHKLANVYDGSALSATSDAGSVASKNTYIFKLANPHGAANKNTTDNTSSADNPAQEGNDDANKNRAMLLMESGVRFHTTTYFSSSSSGGGGGSGDMPSNFAMKLRKHLRNLRLENATQLGNLDRVVDFRFGSGQFAHHILLELYAQGNIVLTDSTYTILALLRTHEYVVKNEEKKTQEDEEVKVRVGNVYPVTYATTLSIESNDDKEDHSKEKIAEDAPEEKEEADEQNSSSDKTKNDLLGMNGEEAYSWFKKELSSLQERSLAAFQKRQLQQQSKGNKNQSGKKGGGGTKKPDDSWNLKMLLLRPSSGVYHYGPSLIEHCILCANLEPHIKLTDSNLDHDLPPAVCADLVASLREEGKNVLENFNRGDGKGFVLYREKNTEEKHEEGDDEKKENDGPLSIPHTDKIFEEFQPHLLRQHSNRLYITYPNFSSAVDEFFSLIEGQKRALRAETAESNARERLAKIKRDQEKRVESLVRDQERLREHAQLIEAHSDDVDKALGVINSALDTGMDWDALDQLVGVEQQNGNPIALLIKKLDLENDSIVLSLPDTISSYGEEEEDSDGGPPHVDIAVALAESAHGNARNMFAKYRASKEKSQKTIEASTKALKAAEANAQRQLIEAQKNKRMVTVMPQRKMHWFEKFHWCITSDNYLVLGGRDAQQNEQLVKRYLRPGDAYLHADVHGAASCILRAKRRRKPGPNGPGTGPTEVLPLPEQALREAGNFTICRSSAWASRMVTSAWWVESHQVSKTAPTGEYLTVGSFMVRGKKNFLPATQLEMGLGVLFRLGDDASVARHANERRDFTLMDIEDSLGLDNDMKTNEGDFDGRSTVPKQPETAKHLDSGHVAKGNDIQPSSSHAASNDIPKLCEDEEDPGEVKKVDGEELSNDLQQPLKERAEETVDVHNSSEKEARATPSQDENTTTPPNPVTKKKKGLSARDRKLIKKYGSLEAAEKAAAIREEEEKAREAKRAPKNSSREDDSVSTGNDNSSKATNNKRGKKTKMKKLAQKYADQDEEDRILAMQALQGGEKKSSGAKKGKGRYGGSIRESSAQQKVAADTNALLIRDVAAIAEKLPQEVYDALSACVTVKKVENNDEERAVVRWDKFDADILEQLIDLGSLETQLAATKRLHDLVRSTRVDNFSASLAGIIRTIKKYGHENLADDDTGDVGAKQRKTKAEKMAEKEAWREVLAEDGIIEVDGDNDGGPIDDTAEIGKLTGKPLPDDVILYVIPVCAPYQILSQYKYRVKLTPGSQKRGKASKQCIEMFLRSDSDQSNSGSSHQYRELIKLVGENEWVQSICGDVKISAPGASKAAKKQKAGKKGGKKKK